MPMPRDHPPDVPAHQGQSPLSVSFDGLRCEDCGQASNPPHKAVADFPDPDADGDPRDRLRCIDCYAELLTEHTSLSKRKTTILGLMLAGYSHEQIGMAIGRSLTKILLWSKEIRDEYRRVEDERTVLAGLMQYL